MLNESDGDIVDWRLVSFATGTKCLNQKQLHAKVKYGPKNKQVELCTFHHRIHDSHAEILVKRAFKLYFVCFTR